MSVNLSEHGLMPGIHSIKIQGCVSIDNDGDIDTYIIDSQKIEFFYFLPSGEKIMEKSENRKIYNENNNEKKKENDVTINRNVVNEIFDFDDVRYAENVEKTEALRDDTKTFKSTNVHTDNDLKNNGNHIDDPSRDINDNKSIITKNISQIFGKKGLKNLKSDSNFLFNIPKGVFIKYPLSESVLYLRDKDDDDNVILNGQLPMECLVAQEYFTRQDGFYLLSSSLRIVFQLDKNAYDITMYVIEQTKIPSNLLDGAHKDETAHSSVVTINIDGVLLGMHTIKISVIDISTAPIPSGDNEMTGDRHYDLDQTIEVNRIIREGKVLSLDVLRFTLKTKI
jgi:hypothetical protein